MYKSILQFCENDIINLYDSAVNFCENPDNPADFIKFVKETFLNLSCSFIGEVFQEIDDMIRNSALRKRKWVIVHRVEKHMLTSTGLINYQKTLFKNKHTGERTYLLDRYMNIGKNIQMTEDAEAQLLTETVQTSYERAGNAVSIFDKVSRQTVKNRIHNLVFPEFTAAAEKRCVRNLYIDADEAHVPLQFFDKKGDTLCTENKKRRNNVQVKLIYVYEGIKQENSKSSRHQLIAPYYFSGIYEGKDNVGLWEKVYEYIDSKYDLDHVENIYLNADGGNWIKAGISKLSGVITVLDEYHLNKYLTQMTSHLNDNADKERAALRNIIRSKTKAVFRKRVKQLSDAAVEKKVSNRIESASEYILSNWMPAKIRLMKKVGVIGSSTEAHVSHILASRMSSRPMGWSRNGADKMAGLIAYYKNNGDMFELVRYQKKSIEKDIRNEILSAKDILSWENQHRKANGKYYDKLQHSLNANVRKLFAVQERLNYL